MDFGSTIVGVIVLLICIIPFVVLSRNNRKRKQIVVDRLNQLAERSNCSISRFDIWNNSAVGIDDTAHQAFFTRKINDTETALQINLLDVQKCRLMNTGRTVNPAEGNQKVIEKLELVFTYRNKDKRETSLEFYNRDFDSLTLSGELQLIEKWGKIFNDTISVFSAQK